MQIDATTYMCKSWFSDTFPTGENLFPLLPILLFDTNLCVSWYNMMIGVVIHSPQVRTYFNLLPTCVYYFVFVGVALLLLPIPLFDLFVKFYLCEKGRLSSLIFVK